LFPIVNRIRTVDINIFNAYMVVARSSITGRRTIY